MALVAEVAELASVYRRLTGARIRSQLQYRTSFVLEVVGAFIGPFLDFLAILVVFGHLTELDGWTLPEIAFLYGTAGLSFALCDLVVGHLDRFNLLIRDGTFDVYLLRPLGTLFQVLAADVQLRRIGKVMQAGGVFVWACAAASIDWTPDRIVLTVVMVLAGAAIFVAVWIAGAAVCFWTTDTIEINNAFTYGGATMTAYPLGIFSAWLRRVVAVLGIAFVNFLPALHVLGRDDDPLGLPTWARFASPAVALALALASRLLWRTAVRHYRSTGS